jgi:hypothetical protein
VLVVGGWVCLYSLFICFVCGCGGLVWVRS